MPRFIATYDDGTDFAGGLTDGSFASIDQPRLRSFTVLYEGIIATLDLKTGAFSCPDGSVQTPPIAPAPRLIAYATMQGSPGMGERLSAFVVGWQSTVPAEGKWRNIRLGLRVLPIEGRWELTEAI